MWPSLPLIDQGGSTLQRGASSHVSLPIPPHCVHPLHRADLLASLEFPLVAENLHDIGSLTQLQLEEQSEPELQATSQPEPQEGLQTEEQTDPQSEIQRERPPESQGEPQSEEQLKKLAEQGLNEETRLETMDQCILDILDED